MAKYVLMAMLVITSPAWADALPYDAECRLLLHNVGENKTASLMALPQTYCLETINKKLPISPSEKFRRAYPPADYKFEVNMEMSDIDASAISSVFVIDKKSGVDVSGGGFISVNVNETKEKWSEQEEVLNQLTALSDAMRLLMEACTKQPSCVISNEKYRGGSRHIVTNNRPK